ncbi:hypothetical protein K402DRAFT_22226 [Aulographum hederae CBS 113979]|uniref:Uncharacterized protein n=1 Tax=Aulographum hederae CBS 113979 TaxID=1176131 RepID=A0A6G1H6V7_9PEZI|nr:hypothetical protein K402DRAFT_22226 [Aulographum hederae CBS 113979]
MRSMHSVQVMRGPGMDREKIVELQIIFRYHTPSIPSNLHSISPANRGTRLGLSLSPAIVGAMVGPPSTLPHFHSSSAGPNCFYLGSVLSPCDCIPLPVCRSHCVLFLCWTFQVFKSRVQMVAWCTECVWSIRFDLTTSSVPAASCHPQAVVET